MEVNETGNSENQLHKKKYIPRELKGLEFHIKSESMGGNAGYSGVAANARYDQKTDEFIFMNDPGTKLVFKIKVPNLNDWLNLKKGEKETPMLIEEVASLSEGNNQKLMKLANDRAIQHNVSKAIDYLQAGGSWDKLVKTDLLPPEEEVRKMLRTVNTNRIGLRGRIRSFLHK